MAYLLDVHVMFGLPVEDGTSFFCSTFSKGTTASTPSDMGTPATISREHKGFRVLRSSLEAGIMPTQ